MDMSKNARAAITFTVMSAVIVVYDAAGEFTHPQWGKDVPVFIMSHMDFFTGILVPAFFLLAAFSLARAWTGNRNGYAGIIATGIISGIWNIFPAVWRIQAGQPYAAAICLAQIILAGTAVWYALGAFREARPVRRQAGAPAESRA
ncbi:MAG: hypothetical protein J2P32_07080 [Actinobacteria bacterium]|nr:hypothetical protein [Actinomycetota bacterium]